MKLNKKSIQIIILVILVLTIGFYFFNEFYLSERNSVKQAGKEVGLEDIFEFKVVRKDLTPESIEKYRKSIENHKNFILESPDKFSFSSVNSIAMTKRILHDFEGAEKVWQYLSYKSPENSLSYFNLAILYMEDFKDNKKAEENFKIVLENSKKDANNAQYYRAILDFYTYYYPENNIEAEKMLLEALERENKTDEFEIFVLLATYYKNDNQELKAKEYWQKALKLDPNNEAIKKEIQKL